MKRTFIFFIMAFFFSSILVKSSFAAPYRPPAYHEGGYQGGYGGYSQSSYKDKSYSQSSYKPKPPTPTPCVPNLCFFGDTPCCISPMCVLLGQTSHDSPGTNRCPESKKKIPFYDITKKTFRTIDFLKSLIAP